MPLQNIDPEDLEAIFRAYKAVLGHENFADSARAIFDEACQVTGARAGYVALLTDDGDENEVLFLEDGGWPCTVDPKLPMPIRGLREIAYREHRTVYDNDFMASEWVKFMPSGHVEMKNVMFSPLVIKDKVEGVMGLANKDGDFTDRDAQLATALGESAAIALANSRTLEQLRQTISELNQALEEVQTLRGILPICSYCKKVRDNEGYWQEVDAYITSRTEAVFSHGMCDKCLEEHYPNLGKEEQDK